MTTQLETIIRHKKLRPTMDDISLEAIGGVKSLSQNAEIYLGETEPEYPSPGKTIWFDLTAERMTIKYYTLDGWKIFSSMIVAR